MDDLPIAEVAQVLAELADESPATLLHACRRLIEYFPASGRLWWLSARALAAAEPVSGIWEAADELLEDPTGKRLAEALPAGASLLGPGTDAVLSALRRRRGREGGMPNQHRGRGTTSRRREGQSRETGVARPGVAARGIVGPGVVVVPVLAAGPHALLLEGGAARRVPGLREAGRAVWAVVPRGTVLPEALWEQLVIRARGAGGVETLGPEHFSALAGPNGLDAPAGLLSHPTCPPVAELLGWHS